MYSEGKDKMKKKRVIALIIFSPLILVILTLMLLTSCIYYAVTGKWELMQLVTSFKT